jgi:hypothetical protein
MRTRSYFARNSIAAPQSFADDGTHLIRKTAVGTPVDEPSPSAASVWSNGSCHPFGEMRGS